MYDRPLKLQTPPATGGAPEGSPNTASAIELLLSHCNNKQHQTSLTIIDNKIHHHQQPQPGKPSPQPHRDNDRMYKTTQKFYVPL
jgi:hypothetical protein